MEGVRITLGWFWRGVVKGDDWVEGELGKASMAAPWTWSEEREAERASRSTLGFGWV